MDESSCCVTKFHGGTKAAEKVRYENGAEADEKAKDTPIYHCKIYNDGAPDVHIEETCLPCLSGPSIGSFDNHVCGCTTGDHCCPVSHGTD